MAQYEQSKLPGQRSSNLELYRILVMLLIVAHHYVVNSGLTAASGPIYSQLLSLRSQAVLVAGAFGKTGINCFLMITGYYMCRSQITLRKFFKLIFQIQLYKVVIYLIFLAAGRETLSPLRLVKLLLPAAGMATGFVSCFIIFYLCIPFLNILIHHMNQRQHFALLAVLLLSYTGLALIPTVSISMNYVTWFCIPYLIAAYIRLYPGKRNGDTAFWGWLTVASFALSVLSVPFFSLLRTYSSAFTPYYLLSDANRLLAVTNSVCLFQFFRNLHIPHSRTINALGGAAFGVLMIHANSEAMREWLWKDLLHNTAVFSTPWLPVHLLLSTLGIYAVCAAIDLLRIRLIERPALKLWDRAEPNLLVWWKNKEQQLSKLLHFKEELP